MSKNQKSNSVGGVKFRKINGIFSIIMCVLCVLIFMSLLRIRSCYEEIIHVRDDYVECNKAVTDFQKTSNFLTNQCRFFVVKQNVDYLDNYMKEINYTKGRQVALDIVEMSHNGDDADNYLKAALKESNKLLEIELYSMRLVCDAIGITDVVEYEEIKAIKVNPEDAKLSSTGKLEKAKSILFDTDYLLSREVIDSYEKVILNFLINQSIEETSARSNEIRKIFFNETVLAIVLLVIIVLLQIMLEILVLVPLSIGVKSIQNGVRMNSKGSYEVKFIAHAYNELCEKTIVTSSILKYKAEHDPLTGLINREAFDQIKDALKTTDEPLAYLIVDIDLFKQINDKYGHSVGDDVLRKISNLLMEQFRATDYVSRIGGDEFAIIMTKIGSSPEEIIQRKIEGLNNVLQNIQDGLPTVSLSVGVAFSDNGYKEELVDQADKALYKVKKGGRCNCSFFDDEDNK